MIFTKMQGAGNDFVLIEISKDTRDWGQLSRLICTPHYGVGADGLLLLLPSTRANFRMRMFNPDGTEAEACGNGLRCLVRYIWDRKLLAPDQDTLSIETAAGVRQAWVKPQGKADVKIEITMGKPRLEAQDIPVASEIITSAGQIPLHVTLSAGKLALNLYLVSMGNPHAVCFLPSPVAGFPLTEIGPLVEHHPTFPQRTNFEIVHFHNRREVEARVWERGAGETLACGSGACAIAVAAQLTGRSDDRLDVHLPGGTLEITWDRRGEIRLAGPAQRVFRGAWLDHR
jgi:diaminopimelate epimerase